MDLGAFLLALVKDWISLMSGIASLALSIVGFFWKGDQPRWWFGAAAIVCIVLASARIWTSEHRKWLAELNQNQPGLIGKIVTINRHVVTNGNKTVGTGVLAVIEIRNLGADSIADSFKVSIVSNKKRVFGELHTIPKKLELEGPDYEGKGVYFEKDEIYSKTASDP